MDSSTLKCGYCGFLLRGSCGNALVHECFSQFNENEHVLNIDDNYVITMLTSGKIKGAKQIDEDEEENADLSSEFLTSNLDEILIDLVHVRRCLWDHTIPIKERTKLKKEALWQEIVNTLGGSLTVITAKQKWKQLRDSYVKARKRMQGYVRSGSGAEAAHPQKSSFSHYERMRFLDDTFKAAPTINSLHEFLSSSSRASDEYSDYNAAPDIFMECVDDSVDTRSVDLTDSDHYSATSRTHLPPNVSRSNKKKIDKHTQLQETFLKVLNEVPQRERDAVEGFLDQLGDLLRHLPYLRRRNFQKRIMDLAMIEEDEMLAENVQ